MFNIYQCHGIPGLCIFTSFLSLNKNLRGEGVKFAKGKTDLELKVKFFWESSSLFWNHKEYKFEVEYTSCGIITYQQSQIRWQIKETDFHHKWILRSTWFAAVKTECRSYWHELKTVASLRGFHFSLQNLDLCKSSQEWWCTLHLEPALRKQTYCWRAKLQMNNVNTSKKKFKISPLSKCTMVFHFDVPTEFVNASHLKRWHGDFSFRSYSSLNPPACLSVLRICVQLFSITAKI